MEIELLGTGTSVGVPQIGCQCEVCQSRDERDKRMRTSAIVRTRGVNLLIDCGPDFRTQMLQATAVRIDALLVTHEHYDHLGGLDDLRPFCYPDAFPIYARQVVLDDVQRKMPYCFSEHPYPGSPRLALHAIDTLPFDVKGVEVQPIKVWHAKNYEIRGYRIGKMAYVTDAKTIDAAERDKLRGLDLLVVNALRVEPHPSHQSLSECLETIEDLKPQSAILTHVSHGLGLHEEVSAALPRGVELGYDGMLVAIDD